MIWSQDDAHWTITCVIWMDHACLRVKSFATSPLISLFCSPLPPYKTPCFHWEGEKDFDTWVPIFPGDGLWDVSPHLPGCWHLKINHFPFRAVQPEAWGLNAAQDVCECGPTQSHKIYLNHYLIFLCVITSRNVFNVWLQTTLLLPVWPRDAKNLDTSTHHHLPVKYWLS